MTAPGRPGGDRDKPVLSIAQGIGLFAALLIVWLGVPAIGWWYAGNPKGSGELGDSFGSVNALFTGLAFAGLIYTVLLQRRELESSAKAQAELVERQHQTAELMRQQGITQSMTSRIDALRTAKVILRERIAINATNLNHVGIQLRSARATCLTTMVDPAQDAAYTSWSARQLQLTIETSRLERELRQNDDAMLRIAREFDSTLSSAVPQSDSHTSEE